jgi:HTH-type transcriptional regulator, sugar sensing transcriptional regulator
MENIQSLRHIGLSEKEAKVYLALLQLGRSTAYSVAVKAGIKRPTTYLILDELVKAGFAYESPRSLKKMFEAKAPEEVFALARERMKVAESALPSIQALARTQKGRTQALYFEGVSGVEQALMYRIKDGKDGEAVGFYGSAVDASPEVLKLSYDWLENYKRLNIRIRGFVPKDKFLAPIQKEDKKSNREFRSLPKAIYSSTISIDTISDFVRIVDIVSPIPQATIIENAEVAKTIREVFERLWEYEIKR